MRGGPRPLSVSEGAVALLPILADLLQRWDAAAPPRREEVMSDSTRRALEALGYLDGSPPVAGEDGGGP